MERQFQINWPLFVEEAVRRRRGMKLTQKQLATLAKISTPTISRFENAEKDLQLSSVLAILEVLGMADKRTLTFAEEEFRYDSARGAVAFSGQDNKKRVLCRVSREALEDHFSEGGRLRPEAAFKKNRSGIEALARRKYVTGQREPDGSVLIRTGDIA
jgi:transcriptional regulator with XRE-family HTH domain